MTLPTPALALPTQPHSSSPHAEAQRAPSAPRGERRLLPVLHERPAERNAPSPRSVRLSVTDRCDFACTYCRPSRSDGYASERLDLGAWKVLVSGLLTAGVRRFRLTGGEPLVHPEVVRIVSAVVEVAAAAGLEREIDLAMTTNASQLARLAKPLAEAGLRRINVSIDTLDEQRFRAITRGGELAPVLAGIDAALEAGLTPLKLNTVVLRGVNDDELEGLVRFAWARGMVPRFLEVMPIAEGAQLARSHLVTVAEMRASLAHLLQPDPAVAEPDRGPAKYVRARGASERVGFISGTSDTYCGSCDRLRVSSTGTLRPCLATDDGVESAAALAAASTAGVADLVGEAWLLKPDGRTFKGCTESSAAHVSMRAIGG
ncbi:MAG: GTP 3',8-cyclase MoaA [Polyangiaceae bacterium]|nr:GTP 3',8-cyclase MoaA [Polyangiaceae bacterium]MBK8941535.1 GTP 3',8-cyclase MoaA [Polyangiaceae bacterium]